MSPRLILAKLRAALSRSDAGITLTELIVTMGLSTLIGAMTLGVVVAIDSSSAATTDRTISSSSARSTIQAWTAYLRVTDGSTAGVRSNRVEWLTAKDMLFYADLNNRSMDTVATTSAPTMVWLRLDTSGALVEEQFASTAASGAKPTACRILLSNVTTPATSLFTGIDAAGASMGALNLGTAPTAGAGCQVLPVTVPSRTNHPDLVAQVNLQNLSSVAIDFVVRDTSNAHPIEFHSQAVLPNLGGQ
jgi:hypothetical protein